VRPKQSLLGKLHRARLDNPFEVSKDINLEDKSIYRANVNTSNFLIFLTYTFSIA
jgi:hypothetical protein